MFSLQLLSFLYFTVQDNITVTQQQVVLLVCNAVIVCDAFTDVLRAQYRNLTTKLDAHIVAVHMYQRNALTLRELQSIQSLRGRPVEAAETLLNFIMEQPDAVYLCFLDVLKHVGQRHLYQRLVENGYKGK